MITPLSSSEESMALRKRVEALEAVTGVTVAGLAWAGVMLIDLVESRGGAVPPEIKDGFNTLAVNMLEADSSGCGVFDSKDPRNDGRNIPDQSF